MQGAVEKGGEKKGAILEKPHDQYTCSLSPFSFPLQRGERERGAGLGERQEGAGAEAAGPSPWLTWWGGEEHRQVPQRTPEVSRCPDLPIIPYSPQGPQSGQWAQGSTAAYNPCHPQA